MHGNNVDSPRCDCKSTLRALVLLAKNFPSEYPELIEFASGGDWAYDPELQAIRVEVGGEREWAGVAEVLNFMRAVLVDPGRLEGLRAAWVEKDKPLAEQALQLIHAGQLTSMVQMDSSPLAEILTARRIETWYQPVVRADTGELWGHECLMRGRTAAGELVGAPQMLAWAGQERLTFMLDRVCREVHLENAGRVGCGGDHKFLINFLPTAIYRPEFCLQSSMAAARRSGLLPRQVIFEVVETEKVTDREHLLNILGFYRAAGFGVALDDLGGGYSGLALLGDLRPDLIKLDRELVVKAVSSDFHREICASLITLGKKQGRLVLAEGVETADELSLMKGLGVHLFQGYLFGRPSPAAAAGLRWDMTAPALSAML
ncbi:MAG: EAL domain-containing protein [Pyrinomonadaceae bacterium]